MRYGQSKNERVYYSSSDVAERLDVPVYQVARLESRYNIVSKKNRAGNRVFLEKELRLFERIQGLINLGKPTDEIKSILKNEEDIRKSIELIDNKDFADPLPSVKSPIVKKTKKTKKTKKKKVPNLKSQVLVKELTEILSILKS